MSGGTRSYEMARRLVQWGHEVHIVTSWRKPCEQQNWFEENIDGIHVHWLPIPYDNTMGFWRRLQAFFRFAIQAGSRAAEIGGDVVFATSTPLTIALPGAFASWRLKVPMVFEVRDLWPEVPIAMGFLRNPLSKAAARWLEKFAYSRAARIIALSEGMADGITATGYPRKKVSVIPNSADLDLFRYDAEGSKRFRQTHAELGNGPLVLYPGTLGRVNGVTYLAHLAKGMLAHRPDVRFVVIGEGVEAPLVKDTAKKLGVLNVNFFQYPPMPKRTLVDAFSDASVIISLVIDEPALWANSANKFFDALASGTAIAINYQGWQAHLLRASDAGVVLDTDPDTAVLPLLDLLNTPNRIAECGYRARELAEQRFDRNHLARQLEKVLLDATLEAP